MSHDQDHVERSVGPGGGGQGKEGRGGEGEALLLGVAVDVAVGVAVAAAASLHGQQGGEGEGRVGGLGVGGREEDGGGTVVTRGGRGDEMDVRGLFKAFFSGCSLSKLLLKRLFKVCNHRGKRNKTFSNQKNIFGKLPEAEEQGGLVG